MEIFSFLFFILDYCFIEKFSSHSHTVKVPHYAPVAL